jgi:ADP-heptose:LPS heptosyltransferase
MSGPSEKILVIKLSALGDFVIALGAMKAIRAHHPEANITLFTTRAFRGLAEQSGYFDEIWIDSRPKLHQLPQWFALRSRLNNAQFSRVYDLQNNDRTAIYYSLISPKPEWVGSVRGASHHYDAPERTAGLPLDGLRLLLAQAGIQNVPIDTLEWISTDIARFHLTAPYALLVPGSAPSRPEKRWPAGHFAALAAALNEKGVQPVILGTEAEKDAASEIKRTCPPAVNLVGNTSLFDIVTLARGAVCAVGNDTGPMHMIAPTGCPSLVLFSGASDPVRNAPMGGQVRILREEDIASITPETVLDEVKNWAG